MKILIIVTMLFSLSFSKVFYSKVEPYELRDISSSVSGEVIFTDEDMIGKKLSTKAYVLVDAQLDNIELKYIEEKLEYLQEMVVANESVLLNLENSLQRKRMNYKRVEALKTKSIVEKDREFYDLVSSENLFLNTQNTIQNLKVQIADLKLKKAYLIKAIDDKSFNAKGFVLYSILVKRGQVIGMATPVAKVADVSRAILTIYIDKKDVADAKNKLVYIDGERTIYKISRVLNIADSKNISKYMAQIIIDAPKVFSKVVKIELRDE